MNLRERISAAYKGFVQGDWVSSGLPGNRGSSLRTGASMWIPGTRINWDRVTGDILSCPASRACINWKARNRPQAPIIVEKVDRAGEWSRDTAHPLEKRLRWPNPVYDGDTLLNMASFSLDSDGNAYILIEYTNGGEVAELWWWPHNQVQIPPGENDDEISSYLLSDRRGFRKEVSANQIIHLKWGLNPDDWRFGLSPVGAFKRDQYSLQQSSNYRANILRNFGTVGVILSPKTDNNTFIPAQVKEAWRDKTTGDNVGDAFAIDVPIDAEFPGVTPQTMAIETMDDRPEANICALFGLTPNVVGLHAGRLNKTQANALEDRERAWEECVMPENYMLSRQLTHRLLPLYAGSGSPEAREAYTAQYRIGFDYSEVRPLQPDLDKKHGRLREDWKANLLTYGEWCMEVGRKPPKAELADMRYRDLNAPVMAPEEAEDAGKAPPLRLVGAGTAGKSLDWASRVISEIEELERLHGGDLALPTTSNGIGH